MHPPQNQCEMYHCVMGEGYPVQGPLKNPGSFKIFSMLALKHSKSYFGVSYDWSII